VWPALSGHGRSAISSIDPAPDICKVHYHDHWVDVAEKTGRDFDDDLVCTVVGFIVRADDRLISVAAERLVQDGQVTYRGTTHIWRSCLIGEPELLLGVM
jgi:hypothetical protein